MARRVQRSQYHLEAVGILVMVSLLLVIVLLRFELNTWAIFGIAASYLAANFGYNLFTRQLSLARATELVLIASLSVFGMLSFT